MVFMPPEMWTVHLDEILIPHHSATLPHHTVATLSTTSIELETKELWFCNLNLFRMTLRSAPAACLLWLCLCLVHLAPSCAAEVRLEFKANDRTIGALLHRDVASSLITVSTEESHAIASDGSSDAVHILSDSVHMTISSFEFPLRWRETNIDRSVVALSLVHVASPPTHPYRTRQVSSDEDDFDMRTEPPSLCSVGPAVAYVDCSEILLSPDGSWRWNASWRQVDEEIETILQSSASTGSMQQHGAVRSDGTLVKVPIVAGQYVVCALVESAQRRLPPTEAEDSSEPHDVQRALWELGSVQVYGLWRPQVISNSNKAHCSISTVAPSGEKKMTFAQCRFELEAAVPFGHSANCSVKVLGTFPERNSELSLSSCGMMRAAHRDIATLYIEMRWRVVEDWSLGDETLLPSIWSVDWHQQACGAEIIQLTLSPMGNGAQSLHSEKRFGRTLVMLPSVAEFHRQEECGPMKATSLRQLSTDADSDVSTQFMVRSSAAATPYWTVASTRSPRWELVVELPVPSSAADASSCDLLILKRSVNQTQHRPCLNEDKTKTTSDKTALVCVVDGDVFPPEGTDTLFFIQCLSADGHLVVSAAVETDDIDRTSWNAIVVTVDASSRELRMLPSGINKSCAVNLWWSLTSDDLHETVCNVTSTGSEVTWVVDENMTIHVLPWLNPSPLLWIERDGKSAERDGKSAERDGKSAVWLCASFDGNGTLPIAQWVGGRVPTMEVNHRSDAALVAVAEPLGRSIVFQGDVTVAMPSEATFLSAHLESLSQRGTEEELRIHAADWCAYPLERNAHISVTRNHSETMTQGKEAAAWTLANSSEWRRPLVAPEYAMLVLCGTLNKGAGHDLSFVVIVPVVVLPQPRVSQWGAAVLLPAAPFGGRMTLRLSVSTGGASQCSYDAKPSLPLVATGAATHQQEGSNATAPRHPLGGYYIDTQWYRVNRPDVAKLVKGDADQWGSYGPFVACGVVHTSHVVGAFNRQLRSALQVFRSAHNLTWSGERGDAVPVMFGKTIRFSAPPTLQTVPIPSPVPEVYEGSGERWWATFVGNTASITRQLIDKSKKRNRGGVVSAESVAAVLSRSHIYLVPLPRSANARDYMTRLREYRLCPASAPTAAGDSLNAMTGVPLPLADIEHMGEAVAQYYGVAPLAGGKSPVWLVRSRGAHHGDYAICILFDGAVMTYVGSMAVHGPSFTTPLLTSSLPPYTQPPQQESSCCTHIPITSITRITSSTSTKFYVAFSVSQNSAAEFLRTGVQFMRRSRHFAGRPVSIESIANGEEWDAPLVDDVLGAKYRTLPHHRSVSVVEVDSPMHYGEIVRPEVPTLVDRVITAAVTLRVPGEYLIGFSRALALDGVRENEGKKYGATGGNEAKFRSSVADIGRRLPQALHSRNGNHDDDEEPEVDTSLSIVLGVNKTNNERRVPTIKDVQSATIVVVAAPRLSPAAVEATYDGGRLTLTLHPPSRTCDGVSLWAVTCALPNPLQPHGEISDDIVAANIAKKGGLVRAKSATHVAGGGIQLSFPLSLHHLCGRSKVHVLAAWKATTRMHFRSTNSSSRTRPDPLNIVQMVWRVVVEELALSRHILDAMVTRATGGPQPPRRDSPGPSHAKTNAPESKRGDVEYMDAIDPVMDEL